MSKPFVSIIIPVFNGSSFIDEAIESCISQTYKNLEILVVDDGSTDNTKKICEKYKNKIRYFYKKNGGVSSALNFGIEKCKGQYISWLSHDDYYLPNKIEDEIKTALSFGDEAIIFSNYYVVNSKNNTIRRENFAEQYLSFKKPQYPLIYSFWINGCAMLLPKTLFQKYKLFDPSLKYTQDYQKWFEMINEKFIYNDSYVLCSRRHKSQGTELYSSNSRELDELWFRLIKWMFDNSLYTYFLGEQESLYFFKKAFSKNKTMSKTLGFLNSKELTRSTSNLKKSIYTRMPKYRIRSNVFYNVFFHYRIYGLKLLLRKIFISIRKN